MSKIPDDKVLPILLFGMLIIGGAYALFITFKDKKPSQADQPSVYSTSTPNLVTTATNTPSNNKEVKTYTIEEVAAHGALGDSEECWTVIHGKVYDVTEFAATKHPGGELIYQACGIDATKLFETRPMGSKTPHSENARKILEQFYIGDLKN